MPLIDLKSDLSFYGKTPPGFKPNARPGKGNLTTDYKANDDLSFTTVVQGFSDKGEMVSFRRATSANEFVIGDESTATRLSQLGNGTRFPVSPQGEQHTFDIKRTGFSANARYGDVYNNLSTAGLADTYTIDSPIDDMYNKFKVRDEAWNPTYIKHPLILRGIQRNGKSDPQRFGLTNVPSLNIPRGGIVTAAQRTALDVLRVGKFLASPQGLLFLAKQQALTLQNPNINGEFRLQDKKYDPKGLLSITPTIHNRISFSRRYEDIKRLETNDNTRFKLLKGRIVEQESGTTNALLLGAQKLIRRVFTPGLSPKDGTVLFQNLEQANKADETSHRWRYKSPYESTYLGSDTNTRTRFQIDDAEDSLKSKSEEQPDYKDPRVNLVKDSDSYEANTSKNDLVKVYNDESKYFESDEFESIQGDEKDLPGDDLDNSPLQDAPPAKVTDYQKMTYGDVRRVSAKRQPHSNEIFNFQKNAAEWDNATLIEKYGFKNYTGDASQQSDPVNASAIGSGTVKDLVTVKFTPLRTSDNLSKSKGSIQFRAYITSLNDTFSPSWNENNDQGRADSKVLLTGWGREIGLGLIVAAHSKGDMDAIWQKLDELAKLTYPIYAGSGFAGTYVKVTIGNLYKDVPMYVTSLSYDWDTETPWDLDDGMPLYTNVDIGLGWIGTQRPDYQTKVFSYNNDGATKA